MEGKVQIFSARNEAAAAIVQGHLQSEGIASIILDQEETLSQTSGSGEVGIYVNLEDEDRARAIIAQNHSTEN